jgi:hypothetical protein
MFNNHTAVQLSWQALLWRLLLTLLLLLALAGPGLTLFRSVTNGSSARTVPTLGQEAEDGHWQIEAER